VEYPIITENAAALAQFRAGNIHNLTVNQNDVLQTKKDVPALSMYEQDFTVETRRTVFGWENTALRDKRVRQALSMTVARDDWIAAQFNTDTFRSQGLNIETRWNTAITADEKNSGWWLDPNGKDFGPNAKYFKKDNAEAKKLLAAAGFPDGLELTSNHFTTTENGIDYVKFIDLFESMAQEAGFRFKKNIFPYTDYLRQYRDSQGRYNGLAFKLGPGSPSDDPVSQLTYEFSKEGGVGFHGFDAAGKGDYSGDPYVEDQLARGRAEFDTEARRKLVLDLQRYLAEQVYTLRWPGGATGFDLVWPAVRNYRVWRARPSLTNVVALTTWWIDETQPRFQKP
jgi:ABC-type transport system substrate-binding protein